MTLVGRDQWTPGWFPTTPDSHPAIRDSHVSAASDQQAQENTP